MTSSQVKHPTRSPGPPLVPSDVEAALIEAVRRDPPDYAALDALVRGHWPTLFARCRMLTQNGDAASELAQETWCRVLQARRRLNPCGNLAAYLAVVAKNLWRDRARVARRAGALSDNHLWSLDAAEPNAHGVAQPLASVLPDPMSLEVEEQAHLSMDLDRALASLPPHERDALLSRYIDGESAAEIGRRYGRTEQTVTTWLRRAVAKLRQQLDEHSLRPAASGGSLTARS